MTEPTGTHGTPGPAWTAAAVARRLGVAPGTLRSWSQRYGIGPAAHTPGRHRRYTAADVADLDAMRSLVEHGIALPAAAGIVRAQRLAAPTTSDAPHPGASDRSGTAPRPGPGRGQTSRPAALTPPAAAVAELVGAAARLDSDTAIEIVATGIAEQGVLAAWEQLCRPAFDDLDAAVTEDQGCVDSQLLLSWVLAASLRQVRGADGADRPVLLACTPAEQHTLGLEALHAALAERDVPARMLGATVPWPALLHAAEQLCPRAVVVWSQRGVTARPAMLQCLSEQADIVLAAGPGWRTKPLPAAVTGTEHLRAALALITSQTGDATHR